MPEKDPTTWGLATWLLASTIPMPDVVDAPPQITEAQAAKLIAFLAALPEAT